MTRILVIKFGGAALATPARIRRAARRVETLRRGGVAPVVVASAAGHTTDRILRWTSAVCGPAAPPGREGDRALATGEALACALLASALCARGVPAVGFDAAEAGILAEGPHRAGVVRRVDAAALLRRVTAGLVPVVAGFQGVRADGEIVTLGRGGSDLTAVHLARALGARECHLVKDVSGVYERDPAMDPGARLLARVTHDELAALCGDADGIVHGVAVRFAAREGLGLSVYGFGSPVREPGGTRVESGAGAVAEPLRARAAGR